MIFRERKKLLTIDCPVCGCEYLPAEIYIPQNFIGKPYNIEKTLNGKVDVFDGMSIDPTEEYICDNCGTKFKVTAKVSFQTQEVNKKKQFNSVYSTPLQTQKIELFEGINDSNK